MSGSPQVLTVRVPLAIRQRGGRKIVITPDGGVGAPPQRAHVDSALVKALARAHRWKHLLESGRYASISEMATAERIDRGYLGRVLQLTLLAPNIAEMILDGRQPANLALPRLMDPFPIAWSEQRRALLKESSAECQRRSDSRPVGRSKSRPVSSHNIVGHPS